ncbi:MAG: NUDIX hydrolase [Bacteroidales bacterium]
MTYTYDFPRAAITTDAVILKEISGEGKQILLIQRKNPPFKGMWALPGGFLDMDETLEECVEREVQEETGLKGITFNQARAYSAIDRDPRHRTVTIAFYGWAAQDDKPVAGSDSDSTAWFSISALPALAFDHEQIIQETLQMLSEIGQ